MTIEVKPSGSAIGAEITRAVHDLAPSELRQFAPRTIRPDFGTYLFDRLGRVRQSRGDLANKRFCLFFHKRCSV